MHVSSADTPITLNKKITLQDGSAFEAGSKLPTGSRLVEGKDNSWELQLPGNNPSKINEPIAQTDFTGGKTLDAKAAVEAMVGGEYPNGLHLSFTDEKVTFKGPVSTENGATFPAGSTLPSGSRLVEREDGGWELQLPHGRVERIREKLTPAYFHEGQFVDPKSALETIDKKTYRTAGFIDT